MNKYTDPMDDILDRPIAYNPALKRITGSTNAAILLSQAWYWTKRTKDPEGWFYKTRDEWGEETALTVNELDGARKVCRELGVIEEKLKGVPATLYYRVNKSKIYSLLNVQIPTFPESSLPENSQIPEKQESDKPVNINKEPETTTGTTSKRGDLIDGILEYAKQAEGKTYPLRDKIPEPYLQYADWYVQATGQKPRKSVLSDWLLTFDDWTGAGLSTVNLQAAYEYANRPTGGFLVGRPGSLTNTAIALKAKPSTAPAIDQSSVEATRRLLAEREALNAKAVPNPKPITQILKGMQS